MKIICNQEEKEQCKWHDLCEIGWSMRHPSLECEWCKHFEEEDSRAESSGVEPAI